MLKFFLLILHVVSLLIIVTIIIAIVIIMIVTTSIIVIVISVTTILVIGIIELSHDGLGSSIGEERKMPLADLPYMAKGLESVEAVGK